LGPAEKQAQSCKDNKDKNGSKELLHTAVLWYHKIAVETTRKREKREMKNEKFEADDGGRGKRRWIFSEFIRRGAYTALALSLGIFISYFIGSILDPGFSDNALFALLHIMRYTSLLLCAFSLFALGFSVYRLVNRPCVRYVLALCFFFATATFGAGLAILNSLIIATAGGYG
jgi:hypothetical protein